MIDKRGMMRDFRVARTGLSRRIRLRIRETSAAPVASVDPLSGAAPAPSTDTFKYISGQFNLLKTTEDYGDVGKDQTERGVLYLHSMYLSLVNQAYSLYIGGTHKEWKMISVPQYDDARCAFKVIVEASQ